ncbi:hypothetical protein [Rhodohalobacter halophilus]|uniref:hypothetical protein n=1 Tax=Rhodohalobacter halophilus TaxID=1812810 RepID=UPI00083F8890|nr:hypothetical protein [Rhodohalobacter halophilus]
MKLKEMTREELERFIEEKGIGAEKLEKAKRAQRNLNIALLLGSASLLVGLSAIAVYKAMSD